MGGLDRTEVTVVWTDGRWRGRNKGGWDGGALLEGDLSRMATGTVQAFHPAYMT